MATGKPLGEPIADVTGTADGTYSSNEQDLINDTASTVNELLQRLRDRGWLDR